MTLANKGTRYAAHIIKSVNSYDLTQTVKQTQPEILNDELSGNDDVYAIVHRGMRAVADRRATMVNMPGELRLKPVPHRLQRPSTTRWLSVFIRLSQHRKLLLPLSSSVVNIRLT